MQAAHCKTVDSIPSFAFLDCSKAILDAGLDGASMLILIYGFLVVVLVQVLMVFCCKKNAAQQTLPETPMQPTALQEGESDNSAWKDDTSDNKQNQHDEKATDSSSSNTKVHDAAFSYASLRKDFNIDNRANPTQISVDTARGYLNEDVFEVVGDLSGHASLKQESAVPTEIIQTEDTQSTYEDDNPPSSAMASAILTPGIVIRLPPFPRKKPHEMGLKDLQETQEELIDYETLEDAPPEPNSEIPHRAGSLGDLILQVTKARAERERNEKAANKKATLILTQKTQPSIVNKGTSKAAVPPRNKVPAPTARNSCASTSTAKSLELPKPAPAKVQGVGYRRSQLAVKNAQNAPAVKVLPLKIKPNKKSTVRKNTKRAPVKKKRK